MTTAQSLALTSDMWTSSNNDAYMAVTAHLIDDKFKLHNTTFAVTPAPGSHTI